VRPHPRDGSPKIGHLTIFADTQAAIWRITSDDPGPGQKCAIAARKHIVELCSKDQKSRLGSGGVLASAKLRVTRRPTSGLSWKLTNQTRGVEWFRCSDRYGCRPMPPRSLAHLKREFSEAKWTEARAWTKARLLGIKNSKYRPSEK